MKKQNKKMFYYRDLLQKHLKKKELEELLEYNKQEIPVGQVNFRQFTIWKKCIPRICRLLKYVFFLPEMLILSYFNLRNFRF